MSDIDEAFGEQYTTAGHDQLDPPRNPEAKEATFKNQDDGGLTIDGKKVLKMWESFSGWYWYGIEDTGSYEYTDASGNTQTAHSWFGFVQGFAEEWGSFDENELNSMEGKVWEVPRENWHFSGRRNTYDGTVWSDFHQKWIDEDELKKDRKARGFSSESEADEDWWNGLSPAERVEINKKHGILNWDDVDPKDNPMGHTGKGDYSVNISSRRYEAQRPEAQDTITSWYKEIHGVESKAGEGYDWDLPENPTKRQIKKAIKELRMFIHYASMENPMHMGEFREELAELEAKLASANEYLPDHFELDEDRVNDIMDDKAQDDLVICRYCSKKFDLEEYGHEDLNKHLLEVHNILNKGESKANEAVCPHCKGTGLARQDQDVHIPMKSDWDECRWCNGTGEISTESKASEDWQQHLPKGMTIRGYECPICFMSIKFEKEFGGTGKNLYNHLLEKHGVDDSEAKDMVQTAKSNVEDYEKVFKDYESPYTESKANEYLLDKVCPKCGSEIGDAEDEFENSYSITCPLCKETINRDDYDFTASPEWKLEGESKANEAYPDAVWEEWWNTDQTEKSDWLNFAFDKGISDEIAEGAWEHYMGTEADSKSNQNIKNLKLRNQKRQWGRRGEALQDTEYPNPKYHGKSLEELLKIKDEYFGDVGNLDLGDDPDMSDYHDLMWEIGVLQGLYGHAHKTDEGLGDFFKKLSGRGDKTWGSDPITHGDFEVMWNNAGVQQRIKWLEDVQGSADGLQNEAYDKLPQWIQVQLFYHIGDLDKHEDLLETPTISLESYDYYYPKKNKPRTKYSVNKAHKIRKGTGELTKDNLLKHIKSEGTYDPESNNNYNTSSSIRNKTDQYLQELESEGWIEQKMQSNKLVWVPTRHGSGRVGTVEAWEPEDRGGNNPGMTNEMMLEYAKHIWDVDESSKEQRIKLLEDLGNAGIGKTLVMLSMMDFNSLGQKIQQDLANALEMDLAMDERDFAKKIQGIEGGNGSGKRYHQQWMNDADKIDSIKSEDMTKDKFLKRAKAIEIEYTDEDQYRRMFEQLKDD